MTLTEAQLDQTLRSADPAQSDLTADQVIAKDALLARILAADVATGATRASLTRSVRRRHTLRWAVPGVAVACVVGGSVGLSVHGATDANAWTPTPQPADATLVATVRDACVQKLKQMEEASAGHGHPTFSAEAIEQLRAVVTERRGRYTLVALGDGKAAHLVCIGDREHPDQTFPNGTMGSVGVVPPPVGRDQLRRGVQGSKTHLEGQSDMAIVFGEAGSDVRKVTLHSAGVTIQASLANGYFAAWWPSTPPTASANRADAENAITYDVTLANGKVLTNVKPQW